MTQTYNIFGRQIASQYLALGVMGTFGGLIYSLTGKSAAAKSAGPAFNAKSKDEENFIQDFIRENDASKRSASH